MRILSLKSRGFRNLPDEERVEFPPGLFFLQGPNEAGKSNLLRALRFALFRIDRRKKGARDLRLVKWGLEHDFFIELEFESAAGRHLLRRSSAEDRDVLVLPSGEELKTRALREELARLTGVPDERSFDATCCVFQGQLPTPTDEMRSLVEQSSLGAEVDIDGLARHLERKLQELRRGLDRPTNNPGRILLAREELARARRAAAEADEVREMKRRRGALADEFGHMEAELIDRERTREEFGRYLKAKVDEERLRAELARLREEESELDSARTERARVAAELDGSRQALERKQAEFKLAEAASRRVNEIERVLRRLDETGMKAEELGRRIERLPRVSEQDMRNAGSIPRELAGLEAPLRVKVKPLAPDVSVQLVADGRELPPGTLEARASLSAQVKVPGVVEIEVAAEGVEEEQVRKKKELEKLLSKYAVSSPEEVRSLYDERALLDSQLRELRARREGLLGDSDEVELRRDVAGLRERAQPAEGLRGAVERMEAELTKLERRSAALGERVRSRGEDIPKRRDDFLANLAKVGGELEGLESYAAFGPEARARIERESEELRGRVGEKRRELHSLEGAISQAERQAAGGAPDVEGAGRKLAALERRALVYERVREGLMGAKLKSVASRRSAMEEAVGDYIGRFSLGRYTRCEFSDDFSVRLWSEEKRGWVAPGDAAAEMSSGLKDQLYLACRLAAIETFFKGPKPPVFLDDPLVHFDPDRAAAAIDALAAFAERFQTIVLTCHSYALPEGVTCVALPAET